MSAEQRPDGPFGARAVREKGLSANYGGATPEEVVLAVLGYPPGKKKQRLKKEKKKP